MKTIDETEMQKRTKEKQTKTEKSKGIRSCSERITIASVPLAPKNCSYCYDMNSTSFCRLIYRKLQIFA